MPKKVKINSLIKNSDNPRFIKENKFKKLVKSIKEFPEMLEKRPIIVDENMIVLGGNMRLRACLQAGFKEVWIEQVTNWTDKQKREFIIKDNVGFGEWDWDILGNEYSFEELEDWGLDVNTFDIDDEQADLQEAYTNKIDAPTYTPSDEKPKLSELLDDEKTNLLIQKIKDSKLKKTEKDFLINAAYRHLKFDYAKIADYYAHSDKDTQELIEDSSLIIIDFEKAIAQGYLQLREEITNQYIEEYGEEE